MLEWKTAAQLNAPHTHTHTYIYIYIYTNPQSNYHKTKQKLQ